MRSLNRTTFGLLALTFLFFFAACQSSQRPAAPGARGVAPVTFIFGTRSNPTSGGGEDRGDWSSGGGYAPTSQFNPWFVKNTTVVKYCVEIDEAHFGLDLTTAKAGIREAFDFWKKEFALSRRRYPIQVRDGFDEDIELATQEFVEESCTPETDVRIQLGFLTSEQRRRIQQPRDYVALTMRTQYDPIQLKGRGFIYFAPVRGELAPESGQLGENRWIYGRSIVFRVMAAHEFGHLFGATNSKHTVMRPDIMAWLLKSIEGGSFDEHAQAGRLTLDLLLESDVTDETVRHFCAAADVTEGIPLPAVAAAPAPVRCLRLTLHVNERATPDLPPYMAWLEFRRENQREWHPYAEFSGRSESSSTDVFGHILLTAEQKVLRPKPGERFLPTQTLMRNRSVRGQLKIVHPAATLKFDSAHQISFDIHRWHEIPTWSTHDWYLRFTKAP